MYFRPSFVNYLLKLLAMKNLFMLFLLLAIGLPAFSQIEKTYRNKSLTPVSKKLGFKLSYNNEPVENSKVVLPNEPKNKMPVLELSSTGVFKANNGKGADIYAYSPDNMPVLKPDSTFRSNMPNGFLVKPKRP